ncbi:MAG: hypothetical protein WC728_01820 [Elusimicrobiota bacterium]
MISLAVILGASLAAAAPEALLDEIQVQKLVNGFDANVVKQAMIVYDSRRDKVYVSAGLTGRALAVIDPKTDRVESLEDIGAPGGAMALDASGRLYLFNIPLRSCARYDPDAKTVERLPDTAPCQDAIDDPRYGERRRRAWNGYDLRGVSSYDGSRYGGYPPTADQELNGVYNTIKLFRDGVGQGAIVHGPDTMFFDVAARHGKLYASNTGDGSVSVFDLKALRGTRGCEKDSCWVKDIDLGTTIDELLLGPSGDLYIRNRLGGSVLYKYSGRTKTVSLFADNENNLSRKRSIWGPGVWKGGGIRMWPTGFALGKDGRELYVLSHYSASIDVLDAASGKLLARIGFAVPWKPRTDSLSSIAMDPAGGRLFAVWPELGLVGVADLKARRAAGMIELAPFGFDRDRALNKGLDFVKLAYSPKGSALYVFLTDERKLLMLDGRTFKRLREAEVTGRVDQFNSLLLCNDAQDELYLGGRIFDARTLALKRVLDREGLNIVGFEGSALYADEPVQDEATQRFSSTLHRIEGGKAVKALKTASDAVIPAKYLFDLPNRVVYAYLMAEARILKYDLGRMRDPKPLKKPGRLVELLDKSISPAGIRASRPDAAYLDGRFYVGYTQFLPERAFGILTLDQDLNPLDSRPVGMRPEPWNMPTDLRVAAAGKDRLWCAFETVAARTPDNPDVEERNFVHWERYRLDKGLPKLEKASKKPFAWRPGGFPPPPGNEIIDDPAPFFRKGSYYIATRTWESGRVTVRAFGADLAKTGEWDLDLSETLGGLSLSVYSLVEIEKRVWLIGSVFNGPPIDPRMSSYLMAVPLSDDLKRPAGRAVTLSRNREYQQYVAGARYHRGRLFVVHNVFPGDRTSKGRLKVFDPARSFALVDEAVINDGVFPGDDHITLETVEDKVYVFYPTPEERLRVKVFRYREP